MTGRRARVAREERAAHEALNGRRVEDALDLLSIEGLQALLSAFEGEEDYPQPWEALPDGEEKTWARRVHRLTREDAWPPPPLGLPEVFEAEAAKEEGLTRAAWEMLAALARVMLGEGAHVPHSP